jgi:serine/threonine-protein kinase
MTVLKGTAAVDLFDVCRGQEGELCLVMELLQGMDLDDYLFTIEQRGERMPLARVREVFEPIVSTLETAHAAGILHRDLKPANIFLLESGGVRLLDFGLARLKNAAPLTAAGAVMGSPSFMAPEAWQGVSDLLDPRVDVYSLGVILFRVLTGELPFSGTSMQEKFLSTTTAARPSLLEFRPELARSADDWLALALAVDRERRFANVRALWSALLGVLPVEKRPSMWAAARGAVHKLVGGSQPTPALPLPPKAAKPPPLPEATMALRDDELLRVGAPARKPPPPRVVERTVSMSDTDLIPEPRSKPHH